MDTALPYVPLAKHFRVFKLIIKNMPEWLTPILTASLRAGVGQIKDVEAIARKVLLNPNAADATNRTIFHSLMENAENSEFVTKHGSVSLNQTWLADEGMFLRFAGADTVSSTCVVGCRYLLAEPVVLSKLVEELDSAWPDKNERLKVEVLEKLPYLVCSKTLPWFFLNLIPDSCTQRESEIVARCYLSND